MATFHRLLQVVLWHWHVSCRQRKLRWARCIRYCSTGSVQLSSPPSDGADQPTVRWAREILAAVHDHEGRAMVYEVLENNIGLASNVASFWWSSGRSASIRSRVGRLDEMVRLYDETLNHMVNKMKGSLANSSKVLYLANILFLTIQIFFNLFFFWIR